MYSKKTILKHLVLLTIIFGCFFISCKHVNANDLNYSLRIKLLTENSEIRICYDTDEVIIETEEDYEVHKGIANNYIPGISFNATTNTLIFDNVNFDSIINGEECKVSSYDCFFIYWSFEDAYEDSSKVANIEFRGKNVLNGKFLNKYRYASFIKTNATELNIKGDGELLFDEEIYAFFSMTNYMNPVTININQTHLSFSGHLYATSKAEGKVTTNLTNDAFVRVEQYNDEEGILSNTFTKYLTTKWYTLWDKEKAYTINISDSTFITNRKWGMCNINTSQNIYTANNGYTYISYKKEEVPADITLFPTIFDTLFKLGRDNNSYIHTNKNIPNAGFKKVTDYTLSSKYYKLLTNNKNSDDVNKIKKKMHDKWQGSCFGVATTMGLAYAYGTSYLGLTGNNYFSLEKPCENTEFLDKIQYYFLRQYLSDYSVYNSNYAGYVKQGFFEKTLKWIMNAPTYDTKKDFLKKLTNCMDDKKPKLWCYTTKEGGHAVLITAARYDTDTNSYVISVYDMNSYDNDNPKGAFDYIFIEQDLSDMTYKKFNGEIIDFDEIEQAFVKEISDTSSDISIDRTNSLNLVTLGFNSSCNFKICNKKGQYIEYDGEEINGTMQLYDASTIVEDNEIEYSIKIIGDEYNIYQYSDDVSISLGDDNSFVSIEGYDIEEIEIALGESVKLDGYGEYSFQLMSSTKGKLSNGEQGLVQICGKATDSVTVQEKETSLNISSNSLIKNITATTYKDVTASSIKLGDSKTFNVNQEQSQKQNITTTTTKTTKTTLTPGKISKLTVKGLKHRKMYVKFSKAKNAKKYKIQYSTSKKFKKNAKTKITTKTKLTIKKLKANKTYYVRVRGINGTKQGKWSKTKKIKIKK